MTHRTPRPAPARPAASLCLPLIGRGITTTLAVLALQSTCPGMAQPTYRVPVPWRDSFGTRAAGICGTGGLGSSPYVEPGPPGIAPQGDGCVVPKTNRGPAFRLLINRGTGQVYTRPLEATHFLNKLEQWEQFQRSTPAGQ